MKRILILFLTVVFFAGCSKNDALDKALALREKLQQSNGCKFEATVTADYGEKLYTFTMLCEGNPQGNLSFSVLEPESIRDITGMVSSDGGKLTFDSQVLAFPLMADGQVSPVSAPWLFVKTLMSGYLTACGSDGEFLKIMIDDSYEENALQLEIWADQDCVPKRCEILWKGTRVLSVEVKDFEIL